MTLKEQVRKLVDDLPDDFSLEDLHYRIYVLQKIRRGMDEADRGECISEEEARKRLSKWLVD